MLYCFPEIDINLFLLKSIPKPSLLAGGRGLEPVKTCNQEVRKIWALNTHGVTFALELTDLRHHFNTLNMSMNVMNVCVWETRNSSVLALSSKD